MYSNYIHTTIPKYVLYACKWIFYFCSLNCKLDEWIYEIKLSYRLLIFLCRCKLTLCPVMELVIGLIK